MGRHGYCKNCAFYDLIDDTHGLCKRSILYNDFELVMQATDYCFEFERKNKKQK
jgi:hypothetical protein